MPNKKKWSLFFPPLWWQYMRSNSDFLLCIRPLSKYPKKIYNSHYSPPGYGIPPGSTQQAHCFHPKHLYGLFLFPGKIVQWFFLFAAILPFFVFVPFLFSSSSQSPSLTTYSIYIGAFWLLSYLFYIVLYRVRMSPVLSNAWEKWPTSAYHLFLSVPHHVSIKEKKWDKNEDEYLYWHPDIQGNMFRQTTEFAPNTQSLQEVILDFAIFEFFFQRPDKEEAKEKNEQADKENDEKARFERHEKAINEKNWYLYLFSPIWLNYILILFFLMVMTYYSIDVSDLAKTCVELNCTSAQVSNQNYWRPSTVLPYSFMPVILIWFALSLWYTRSILNGLEQLHKKVRQGAFNTHLDLVPQQILNELANIPSSEQVNAGMQNIKKLISVISGIALIGFLGLLEVLSQAYGSAPTFFSHL